MGKPDAISDPARGDAVARREIETIGLPHADQGVRDALGRAYRREGETPEEFRRLLDRLN